jgi:hypothetical protein
MRRRSARECDRAYDLWSGDPMLDLNLFDRLADLVTTHPLASLIGALLLGLAAPISVPRNFLRLTRWTVVGASGWSSASPPCR